MSQVINSNVMSLNAQRNLSTSGSQLAQSLQRLSSGLRINGAKDDAAGLAISQRFTAQIRGVSMAMRNAQDAVSLTQTAEGALGSVSNNLQRMRELAVQASNGTNSQVDRDALNAEYDQLKHEIQRVAEQTKFGGMALLDGSFSGVKFQIGANVGESITIESLADVTTGKLGGAFTRFSKEITIAAPGDDAGYAEIAAGTLKIGDTELGAIGKAATAEERAEQLVEAINRVSSASGVGASRDGDKIMLASSVGDTSFTGFTTDDMVDEEPLFEETADGDAVGVGANALSSFWHAQQAITTLDKALAEVNSARANVGALQSRFESTIANLMTTNENLTASRSRIMDADFAEETAKLTRAQVLQQAGVAMLAQANAVPQNVLSLLR